MHLEKIPFLSIIIPVFNEEKRIKKLSEIVSYLKKQKFSWELIVVNDGSTDKTKKKLRLLKDKLKFKTISYFPNKGKGFAIKTGMLSAKGKYRLFLDIDLSTPINEFDNFYPFLKKFDIIIGSRRIKSSSVTVRQPFIREMLGKMFTKLSQELLLMNISDFTCGFKCFSQKAADQIFVRQTTNRWGFDPEILYIGKIHKNSIKEIPVKWKNDPKTKVKFPQDILNSFKELAGIKINYYRGIYK